MTDRTHLDGCEAPAHVAAIDIGSNSTNLLISTTTGSTITRLSTATRLGSGLDTTRRFESAARDRTLACLGSYREHLAAHCVERVRVVATSACRRAEDFPDFAASAGSVLGHEIELIDGAEEGRLGFLGAVTRLGGSTNDDLVIDIGGGSTELSFGHGESIEVKSLEVGAVRSTEKHLLSDPPLPEELVNAIADVQDLVSDACREVGTFSRSTRVIGCSGTMLAIAAVELGLADVPNGFRLTRNAAEDVFRTLATERLADRVHNPGLPQRRADIIVGGCCILVGILRTLEIDEVTISLGNILHGICHELANSANRP